jgi:hypothetical protein
MSPFKIALLSAGLLAVTASSAVADGFRYAGSPKFGQFYVREKPSPANPLLNARAQLVETPRYMPKGGIGARGP